MAWNATLDLHYTRAAERTLARHRHAGPLRVLKSLYPESPAVCHNVLVHPPGGIAGGDRLDITVRVDGGAHALVSTPGATRFYRSDDAQAVQDVRLQLADGARLEWLPLETLVYPGARAQNRLTMALAPGASLIAWDVVGLGLPHAGRAFADGCLLQRVEWPGMWLEQARIDAADTRLLDGPLGLAGHRCLASLFILSGTPLARARRERLVELARELLPEAAGGTDAPPSGVTSPQAQVIVLRVLAPVVEPAFGLLRRVWSAWRQELWQMGADSPRIWNT